MNKWYRLNLSTHMYVMPVKLGVICKEGSCMVFIPGATLKDFGFSVDLLEEKEEV